MLNPTFTSGQVAVLSQYSTHPPKPSFDLTSKPYLPGYVGLNNIKANDYLNVVIHALLHVAPLRDYLLLSNLSSNAAQDGKGGGSVGKQPHSELLRRFAGLAKKVWNPRLFKAQVSPHEFLQEVTRVSGGKFKLTEQGDPVDFLGWLLNRLHRDMGGTKKRNSCQCKTCSYTCLSANTSCRFSMLQRLFIRVSRAISEWRRSKSSSKAMKKGRLDLCLTLTVVCIFATKNVS